MGIGRWLRIDFLVVAAILGGMMSDHPKSGIFVCLILMGFLIISGNPRLLYLVVSFFLVFSINHVLRPPPIPLPDGATRWVGTIISPPVFDGDQLSLYFQVSSHQKVYATYTLPSLNVKERDQSLLKHGVSCLFEGDVQSPSEKRNPYGFDFKDYLKGQSVYNQMTLSSISKCQTSTMGVWAKIKNWRLAFIAKTTNSLPDPLKGYVQALVFGMKSSFAPEDLSAFQTLGISHILTVSGLHVGLISTGFLGLLRRMGVPKEVGQLLLVLLILPFYMFLSGLSPSVLRAGGMIGILAVGGVFKRTWVLTHVLTVVALFFIFLSPNIVNAISFQLSFLVTYVLLMSWTILKPIKQNWLQLMILSSLAEFGLMPLILFYFYQFSWLSMVVNLIYVPFISLFILPLSFLFVFLSCLYPSLSNHLAWWMNPFIKWPQALLTTCASHSWSSVSIGRPNLLEMIVLILWIAWTFKKWEKLRTPFLKVLTPFGMIVILIMSHMLVQNLNPFGRVVFIDVGQGDCIFIQLPFNKQTILIDTGGRLPFKQSAWKKQKQPFEVGRDVVLKELKGMGINRIDVLVLTHRDFDHIGGAQGLVGHILIRTIMVSPYFVPSQAELVWLNRAKALGSQLKIESPDDEWRVGQATFHVLWPAEKGTTTNARSLVIKGDFGGNAWLFTGDLEIPEEQKLIKRYPNLSVNILKIGHHGSKTASSETFLKTLHPNLAVISVGKNNRYGHPSSEVLKRLSRLKIPYLRTDQVGAITVRFTNTAIKSIQITK